MADNPLTKLPLLGQLLLALVVAAVLCGGFWYFWWSPMDQEQEAKSQKLAALQADVRNLEVTANKLEEFRREVATREQTLETLRRILPADKETADLMKRVQYLASQSSLVIKGFKPGATVRKEFEVEGAAKASAGPAKPPAPGAKPGPPAPPAEYYQEWPISLSVEGNYHNMGTFFDRVSRLSRLVTISSVRIKSGTQQTPSNTIAAACTATTYVYVEGPPVGQPTK